MKIRTQSKPIRQSHLTVGVFTHFHRRRLVDFLIDLENPNGKYFIPSNFGEPLRYGFVPLHAIYIEQDLLKRGVLLLEEIRDRSCILVTNYNGVIQDDIVPHLYDFLATGEEVNRNFSTACEENDRN